MLKAIDLKALVSNRPAVLVFLVACFFGFNYRFFLSEAYLPLHDTGFVFQIFKTAYANFLLAGELPEWLPRGIYGYDRHLQDINGMSPLSYPVMGLGKLFGVLNALFLFKTVIMLEIVVFCLGFLLLADEMFENRAVSLFALAPALMTITVSYQIFYLFRIVYLIPLMAYYILGFCKTGKAWKLVLAGVVIFASFFGNNLYFPIYFTICFLAVFCAFFYVHRERFRLVIGPASIVAASLAVVFMGIGANLILSSPGGLAFEITGRDPETLEVGLDAFLEYGAGGIVETLEVLLARPVSTLDATFYVPAAALVFALYALFRERSPFFLAVAALFAFFLVLAWGRYSPLAYVLYYIPGISYFRHLGLTYAVPKVLLCLMAGFGVQRFLAATAGGEGATGRERRFLAAIASVLTGIIVTVLVSAYLSERLPDPGSIRFGLVVMSAGGFLVTAACALSLKRSALLGAMAFLVVVQGGVYQSMLNVLVSKGNEVAPAVKTEIALARLYPFDETRPAVSNHPRHDRLNAFVRGYGNTQSYTILYEALGLDFCYPVSSRIRLDYFTPGVDALVRHQFGPDARVKKLGGYYKDSPDALFFRLAGCGGRAKLQLLGRFEEQPLQPGTAVPPETLASAVLVENPGSGERRLVRPLRGGYPDAASLAAQGIAVTHFSANRLQAKVDGVGPKGAWLVYADGFHPGWRATVDGRPASVWRANMAFKAVFLPPGARTFGFDFTHPDWQVKTWFVGLFGTLVIVLGSLPGPVSRLWRRGRQRFSTSGTE